MKSAGCRALTVFLSTALLAICSVSSNQETTNIPPQKLNFVEEGHPLITLSVDKKQQLVLESDRDFEVYFTPLTGGPDPFPNGAGPFQSKNMKYESGVPRREAIGHVYKYAAISTDGSNLIIDPHVKVM